MLVAAAVLPYVRLLPLYIYPDAERAVTRNAAVSGPSLAAVWSSDFWAKKRGDPTVTGSYRPVASTTYWLQVHLFGPEPWALHLFDVLLHATGAVLVFLFLQRVVPGRPFAFGAALLYAVHPALSEAVCSVVGRCDLLAATSFLGALLLHHRARTASVPGRWDAGTLALLAVAFLSKEYAVVFPLLLLFFDVLLPSPEMRTWRSRLARFWLPVLVLLGGYAALRVAVLGALGDVRMVSIVDTPLVEWGLVDRCANAVWLLLPALRLLFVPIGLDHVYGIGTLPLAKASDPRFLVALACLAAAAAGAALLWRRRRDPAPLYVLALFVLPLLPALNTVGVTVLLFAERFLVVPAVGFALLVAWGLGRAARRGAARRAAWALVLAVAVVFAARTARRVEDWRSLESLSRSAVRAHPRSAMALHELGMALALRGEYAEAERLVRASLAVQSRPVVWRNLGLVLERLGRAGEARAAFARAVEESVP